MAPPTRPTPKGGAKPGPKPKPAVKPAATTEDAPAEAVVKPAKKRNMRPKMPVFWEDMEAGTLLDLGVHLGSTAEEALGTYLGTLEDDDREQAYAAADYVVFTPDEGIVKLTIIPPTEPTISRR